MRLPSVSGQSSSILCFAPFPFIMALAADSPQSQPLSVERTQTQSECDAKTLTARRKRLEIRRFKLMAAACDEIAEPSPKRPKGFPLKGLEKELKAVCDSAEEQGLKISIVGRPGTEGSLACSTGVITAAGLLMEGRCMDFTTQGLRNSGTGQGQVHTGDEDDKGGAEVKSRLSVSCQNLSSPTHCVVSICGRSREMEDAAIAVPSFLSFPSLGAGQGGSPRTNTFHMYGVFDGHGGPQAAEICKERMATVLAEEMSVVGDSSPLGWESCMQSCFKRLDSELCGICPHGSKCPCKVDASSTSTSSSCSKPLVPGSVGTTAVVAVVGADDIIVGNCGDSRAVLSRGGQAVPLSFDHKASRPDEVARIEAAGGRVFNWQGHRVCGVLAMSRALGDSYLKPYVSGLPEVTVTSRCDEDEFLVLASDGLWDVLSNEFVCSVARKVLAGWGRQHPSFQHCVAHDTKQHDRDQQQFNCGNADVEDSPAQVVAALLTKLALAKHSKDNISVVVVDLKRV